MKNNTYWFRFTIVSTSLLFSFSCSSDNKRADQPVDKIIDPVVFTAIGDVPYGEWQRDSIKKVIATHNTRAKSEFVIHVGDIKTGQTACTDAVYKDASEILKAFNTPTFIVLGDNEYNDCTKPDEGLALWNSYFLKFNTNWTFPHTINYQSNRPENFSWIQNKVLFLGINIVGSSVHDEQEWKTRLTDDANWVKQHIETEKENVNAVVVFGHANITEGDPTKFKPFTDVFRNTAATFGKPVLYLHGDGHIWYTNKPWPEKNIIRVQIDGGHRAVEITVNPNNKNPFSYNRTFLD
tara:strand:- start:12061 stop:12942 length:882 start_codon:yes stop_codon:yes gene_type:complete